MNLSDCRALLTLAETLHFSRAAGQLHMSPSALSRAVQRLEEELGHPLFVRDRRHVSLTRAGQLAVAHARGQLRDYQLLLERLSAEALAPTGTIRLACTVTACHSVLPDVLSRCRERYPGLHLELMTSDSVRAAGRLAAGEADVAVLPLPEVADEELSVRPLSETALCFIARASDRRYAGLGEPGGPDFGQVPFILPRQGLERERLDQFLRGLGKSPNIYAEVSGNEAIIAMVSLGCGVGLVPELVLSGSSLRDSVMRLPVPAGPAGYKVGACVRKRDLRRRAVLAFWELFEETLPAA